MRLLKHHEKKLLKKVDFYSWKQDKNVREASIIRKYRLQDREDYVEYSHMVGSITKLVSRLKKLPTDNIDRKEMIDQLMDRLFNLGVITTKSSLSTLDKVTVSSFCRRRLPVVMVRLKMSENLKEACTLIEQGHVRVGPNVITDTSFIVTRWLEDYVTWKDSSKIKRAVMQYNDKVDDYDLLQ